MELMWFKSKLINGFMWFKSKLMSGFMWFKSKLMSGFMWFKSKLMSGFMRFNFFSCTQFNQLETDLEDGTWPGEQSNRQIVTIS